MRYNPAEEVDAVGAPDFATIAGDAVVAPYTMSDGHHRLTAIAIADGKRRWDVAVPRIRSGHVLAGLTSNGDLVALSMWGLLAVFDVTSGRHLYSIPN